MGRLLYYLVWPVLWFVAPLTIRVRVIIRVGDETLVVKNWFGAGHWEFPGGGKKLRENATEAGLREIKEELGLAIDPKEVKVLHEEPRTMHHHGLLMRYSYIQIDLDTKPELKQSHEITDYTWMKSNSVEIKLLRPEMI